MEEEIKKVEKTEVENGAENKPIEPPKKEEGNNPPEPNPENQPVPETEQKKETVAEAEEKGNGIPLSEVALKSDVETMIKEAVTALQSKLDAVVKENEGLKEELAKAKDETKSVREKYEDNGDFGTSQKKGAGFTDGKSEKSSYVSYEEMWNGASNFTKS